MFNLAAADQRERILGCGDGPASFNVKLTKPGGEVVSIDPLHALPGAFIVRRIAEAFAVVMEQVHRHQDNFIRTHMMSPEKLGRRYMKAALPSLPFTDGAFGLALSSCLLFLYTKQFNLKFHLDALWKMLRAAKDVRVFPLLQVDGTPSPHLWSVMDVMNLHGVDSIIEAAPYGFQQGGQQMLRLRARSSERAWAKLGAAKNLLPSQSCTVRDKWHADSTD